MANCKMCISGIDKGKECGFGLTPLLTKGGRCESYVKKTGVDHGDKLAR